MISAKGYSLWLIPERNAYNKIEGLIRKYSERFGEEVFEPHITLIGEVSGNREEILGISERLSSEIKRFEVELNNVGFGEEYFRSVFLLTNKPKELMMSNEKARKIFGKEGDGIYMPHVSILYSRAPFSERVNISEEMPRDISIKFDVKSLHVIRSEGSPKEWYRVEEFPFKGR